VDVKDLFKRVSSLARAGQADEALALMGDALRKNTLDGPGIEKAGGWCQRLFPQAKQVKPVRVLLLGQCTTSWLASTLTATAWGQGTALLVTEGGFDNIMQDLMQIEPAAGAYDVITLLPWNKRLLDPTATRAGADRLADEQAFWQHVWRLVTNRFGARLQQVGFDWVGPGPHGHALSGATDGEVWLVRQANQRMRDSLPPGASFVDLEQIAGMVGRERFYDARRYLWTKQPFSEAGAGRLCEHLWAGIRALLYGPKKVLVLDLDNTLWGGVVGETGALGVELGEGPDGEAYRAFQRHAKRLGQRGIVLTVASKNNEPDARGPFLENPGMVLALDDFAHFEAHWEPKAVSLKRTAETLQLGLDSFVFFDDNPAEREHIRQALPQVSVVDVPPDPADYIRALDAGLWFEAVSITAEDRQRADQYRLEKDRREAATQFESLDGYLESLEMTAVVRPIDAQDLDRVVQLIGKTNQFNLTTRRHSAAAVRELLDRPGSLGVSIRVADKFGDHGLISLAIAVPGSSAGDLEIDTWLMSCRVIGRTVEELQFNLLLEHAQTQGFARMVGLYIPTPKNPLVAGLYDRLGFTRGDEGADKSVRYELTVAGAQPVRTFVRMAPPVQSS